MVQYSTRHDFNKLLDLVTLPFVYFAAMIGALADAMKKLCSMIRLTCMSYAIMLLRKFSFFASVILDQLSSPLSAAHDILHNCQECSIYEYEAYECIVACEKA